MMIFLSIFDKLWVFFAVGILTIMSTEAYPQLGLRLAQLRTSLFLTSLILASLNRLIRKRVLNQRKVKVDHVGIDISANISGLFKNNQNSNKVV